MEVISGSCMKRKLEFLYAGDSEASRAAMLKKRFSETIFKAQQYKLNNKEIDSVQKTNRFPEERPEKCYCQGYAARVGADMKIDVKVESLRSEEKTRFETLKQADLKSEVKEKSWKCRPSEKKVMRIETRKQVDLRSEIKKRWWTSRCEKKSRFETLTQADHHLKSEVEERSRRKSISCEEKKVMFETLKRQQQRDGERAAAKIKLQKMENSAGIEVNLESFRQLESLSGCTLSFVRLQNQVVSVAFQGIRFWNPLDKFGLKIKDDDDDAIMEEL
ncbi:hypothetical protein Ddye_004400 [Dipteronia dyeriana]|uniref:Uncharacterized protein n=1 Tax=Dipteronia dyeriana TaxID=168575 RepID=A0AAD9XUQ5_9ROSI|nr:hypothetical protein Ddye_004400 [Dipteronia dyeriana]